MSVVRAVVDSQAGYEGYLSRVQDDAGKVSSIMRTVSAGHDRHLIQDYLDIGPLCAGIVAISGQSRGYFVSPDGQARPLWSAFVNLTWNGGRECEAAVNLLRAAIAHPRAGAARSFLAELDNSLSQLATADSDSKKIDARITTVKEAGALASGNHTARPGPLGILPLPPGSTPFPS
jgi:hypothetical protein